MRECHFMLPLADNGGRKLDEVHREANNELLRQFGGFSMQEANGVWRDDATGKIYTDKNRKYTVATLPGREGELKNLVSYLGALARQEAMYFVDTKGQVHFLEASAEAAQEAMQRAA